MSPMGISAVPNDPPPPGNRGARRAWIRYRLAQRGQTFVGVAEVEGVTQPTVSRAALGLGSRHLMRAIARACDVAPGILFPEHFDASGAMRRPAQRPRRASADLANGEAA